MREKIITASIMIAVTGAFLLVMIMAKEKRKVKPISVYDRYIGLIKEVKFQNGGFLSSDRTIIYTDSMTCIVRGARSLVTGSACYIQDDYYLVVTGNKARMKIE